MAPKHRTKEMTIEERLKHYIDFDTCRGSTGCWLWTGPLRQDGYGVLKVGNKARLAHRLVYKHYEDEDGIPDHLHFRHDPTGRIGCSKRCVNPEHGAIGTDKDNMNDHDMTSDFDVERAVRLYRAGGVTLKEVGDKFGVSGSTLHGWLSGKRRRG